MTSTIKVVAIFLIAIVGGVEAARDLKMFLGWSTADLPGTCAKGTMSHLNLNDAQIFTKTILPSTPVQCSILGAAKLIACHDAWEKRDIIPHDQKDKTFDQCVATMIGNLKHCCTLNKGPAAEANSKTPTDFTCKKNSEQMDLQKGDPVKVERQAECAVGRMAQLLHHFNEWTLAFSVKCGIASQSTHETEEQCNGRKKKLLSCMGKIAEHVKRCCSGKETSEAITCEYAAGPAEAAVHMDTSS